MAIWDADFEGQGYFVAAGQMANVNWPWQLVVIAPKSIGPGALQRVVIMLYGSIFLAGILACTVGYAVSRSIGRLLELLHTNALLARHGNIEVMEPVATTAKEIAETNQALHHLAALYREQRRAD